MRDESLSVKKRFASSFQDQKLFLGKFEYIIRKIVVRSHHRIILRMSIPHKSAATSTQSHLTIKSHNLAAISLNSVKKRTMLGQNAKTWTFKLCTSYEWYLCDCEKKRKLLLLFAVLLPLRWMWITSEMKTPVINVAQIHHFQSHSCHMPVSHGFNLNERKTVSFVCLDALIAIVRCKVRPRPERKWHRSDVVCIPLPVWTSRRTDYSHAKSLFVSVMLLLFAGDSFNSINCRCRRLWLLLS